MLKLEEWMEIKMLYKEGHSIRAISRMTGISRRTISKVVEEQSPKVFKKVKRKTKLDEYKKYIEIRYKQSQLSAIRIKQEVEKMGYEGSIATIRRYIREIASKEIEYKKMTVRFETSPGKQAQADWAYAGRFRDKEGKITSIYIFVMVLSYSRYMYVEYTTSMKIEHLIKCHLNAFDYFGGWPESVLYDNMKQVKVSLEKINPLFEDFAKHYGLLIKTHQVRRPRTKGKVERMVDYVKDNFLNGREFANLEELNSENRIWLNNTANVRMHSTTQARPVDLLEQENLTKVNTVKKYQLSAKENRKVNSEGFVHYRGSRYSVPPNYVGKEVVVEDSQQKITVKSQNLIIAQHQKAERKGLSIADKLHIDEMWKITVGGSKDKSIKPPNWQIRFEQAVESRDLSIYDEVAK